ncbi:biosynthetic peptidoglycan transglycosylase, partial [Elizabethkingia anophelis]|uniref:biosynthetic peptidoglycan transglycosylase n=1 Tax=Elizabethkingia anophelis TaxID=1117645 RepID=UPI001625FDD1
MIIKEIAIDLGVITDIINNERANIDKYSTLSNLDKLVDFLIIGEDRRYYQHKGFDVIAIIRAIRNRIFYNKKEGASTIEQQLVRVLTNQYCRTLKRKIKEIILATKLKKMLSKKEIALLYLRLAYFGTDKIGLENTLVSFSL